MEKAFESLKQIEKKFPLDDQKKKEVRKVNDKIGKIVFFLKIYTYFRKHNATITNRSV
jgi:hypothetical protein